MGDVFGRMRQSRALFSSWRQAEQFQAAQADGTAAPFVRVDLVSEAERPGEPQYRYRNTLMLGGLLLGLLLGVVWVDRRAQAHNEITD